MKQQRSSKPSTSSSYRSYTVDGLKWAVIGTTGFKVISLLSQVLLGWWLATEDFAVYAVAIGISALFNSIRSGGVQRILVREGARYDELASAYFRIAVLFNSAIFVVFLSTSFLIARFYDSTQLVPILILIAITTLISTPATILSAKLSIDLQFRAIAFLQFASGAVRVALTLLFAGLGFGAYSFVIPPIFSALFEIYYLLNRCGVWPSGRRLDGPFVREVIPSSAWLGSGALALAVANQGDFLVVGALESKEVLASYFFGYQLVGSLSALITGAFSSVMLPTLSKISHDTDRLAAAVRNSLALVVAVSSPAFIFMALGASPFISVIWAGKWDDAIIVAQLIGIAAAIRTASALPIYLFEALGKWKLWATFLYLDAVCTLSAAYLGATLGEMLSIALVVAIFRVGYSFCITLVAYRMCKLSISELVHDVILPFLTCATLSLPFFIAQSAVDSPIYRASIAMSYLPLIYLVIRYARPDLIDALRNAVPLLRKR